MKHVKRTLIGFAIFIVVAAVASGIYISVYYHADSTAEQYLAGSETVSVSRTSQGYTVFTGPDVDPANTRGLVFYQGAKVESAAYAPLCEQLAERGWTVVLVDAPARLPVLNTDLAQDVIDEVDSVESWYIGGHSMGGAMAAVFASDHADELTGVMLFAAFSSKDLSNTQLQVYSVYGSNDGVLQPDQYASNWDNLPAETTHELVIQGGNHGQFGSYGAQDGDGAATISAEEQIEQAIDFVASAPAKAKAA